jgi:hypothetical protein
MPQPPQAELSHTQINRHTTRLLPEDGIGILEGLDLGLQGPELGRPRLVPLHEDGHALVEAVDGSLQISHIGRGWLSSAEGCQAERGVLSCIPTYQMQYNDRPPTSSSTTFCMLRWPDSSSSAGPTYCGPEEDRLGRSTGSSSGADVLKVDASTA